MPVNDELGKRMKEYYENIPKIKLMRRTPVAIRIDGKAFHTFTRDFNKPFDKIFMQSMQETMKYLCENIQGCVFGYTQSDEITLILIDYQKLNTSAWFDYEVQKICSISASMATMKFNQTFSKNVYDEKNQIDKYINGNINSWTKDEYDERWNHLIPISETHIKAAEKGAMFDARCFNIPKEEVCNLIYWRQLDATRNSIQMVGQAYFSHKELENKTCKDIQNMLFEECYINWNDYPIDCKRGAACIKNGVSFKVNEDGTIPHKNNTFRDCWIIDKNMPILKKTEDIDYTNYVNKWIFVGE